MGKKGAKLTEGATLISEQLECSLADFGDISRRKMFGGYGVFESGVMFALVSSEGGVYLKVTDINREQFEKAGSQKFGRMPYFSIPHEILDDNSSLCKWAKSSIEVAHEEKTNKR